MSRRERVRPLYTRILWTCGPILFLWLLQGLPLPFVSGAFVAEAARHTAAARQSFSMTALGLSAFLTAFVLVETVALCVPSLRRRRTTSPSLRRALSRASVTLGLALTVVQAWSVALYFESLGPATVGTVLGSLELVAHPGLLFRIEMTLTLTAGSALCVAAAQLISEKGVGSGFPVVLLASLAPEAVSELARLASSVRLEEVAPASLVAASAILALVAFGSSRLLAAAGRARGALVHLPVSGAAPLELASAALFFTVSLANVLPTGTGDGVRQAVALLSPGSPASLVFAILVVVLTAPLFATFFYWRQRTRLRQAVERPAWRRALLTSAGFLVGLAIADYLVVTLVGPLAELLPSPLTLLFTVAVVADLAEEVRMRANTAADLVAVAVYHDVADALFDTAGQTVVIQGLRNRALGYFFLPYVPLVVLAPEEEA